MISVSPIYRNDFSATAPEWVRYWTPISFGVANGTINCSYNRAFDGIQMELWVYPPNTEISITVKLDMAIDVR
jgi:hypothetical protein